MKNISPPFSGLKSKPHKTSNGVGGKKILLVSCLASFTLKMKAVHSTLVDFCKTISYYIPEDGSLQKTTSQYACPN